MVKGSLPLQPATSPPVISAAASRLRCRGLVFARCDFDIPDSSFLFLWIDLRRGCSRTSTRPARGVVEHRAPGTARRTPRATPRGRVNFLVRSCPYGRDEVSV